MPRPTKPRPPAPRPGTLRSPRPGYHEQPLGEALIEGLSDAVAAARRGDLARRLKTARHVRVDPPKAWTARDVKGLRARMSVSQAVLADILATSTATVQAWELGRTVPPPMCRLLEYVAGDRDRLSRVLSKSD